MPTVLPLQQQFIKNISRQIAAEEILKELTLWTHNFCCEPNKVGELAVLPRCECRCDFAPEGALCRKYETYFSMASWTVLRT
jgi:hypothetical protein